MSKPNYNVRFSTQDEIKEFKGKFYSSNWPTVPELFKISCSKNKDRRCFEAFYPEHIVFTYSQVYDIVVRLAQKIKSCGLSKGDNIAVSGKNSPFWALAYLAILFSGCTAIPLDNLLSQDEVTNLINFSQVKMAFVDSVKRDTFSFCNVQNIISLDTDTSDSINIIKWIENEVRDDNFVLPDDIDDIAEILFTSGTTGNPKGVMLTHKNLVTDIFYTRNNMKIFESDCFYLILPIHHAYAMMASFLIPLSKGSSVVFGSRMVVAEMVRDLKEGRVTFFLGVPTVFNKLIAGLMNGVKKKGILLYFVIRRMMRFSSFMQAVFNINIGKNMFRFLMKNIGFDNIRICISGAGALPKSTVVQFRNLGVQFVEGYGMTETSPISSLNPIEGYKLSSVGRIFPELEFKFKDVDNFGNGVLCIKGDIVMKGYYKNPEATSETIDEDGFLNTGDVGHVDKDNYFYITGRAKNIIVTDGGKNVFPEEIEDKFQLYDNIIESIIVAPYKDEDGDEKIRAICYPAKNIREAAGANETTIYNAIVEVVAKINKKLQSYKKISKIQISPLPLEMTTTHKPKRLEIIKRMDGLGD